MDIQDIIFNSNSEVVINNRIVEYIKEIEEINDLGIEFYGTCALKILTILEHIIVVDYDGCIKNYCKDIMDDYEYKLSDELHVDIKSILVLQQDRDYFNADYNNVLVYTEQGDIYNIGYNNGKSDDMRDINIEFTKVSQVYADYLIKNASCVVNLLSSQRRIKSAI